MNILCHICQQKHKKSKGSDRPAPSGGSFWICTDCDPAKDRVFELEQEIRKIHDRLTTLSKVISEEPWMIRLSDGAFKPVYDGMRGAIGDLAVMLWREVV